MNAETFNWHNWHEPQARDGDEVACNACKQWSPLSEWQECVVRCDECGEHAAVQCPKCKAVIDLAMETLMTREPQERGIKMSDTKQIDDGGPAFPLQSIGPEFQPGHCGMTLRDWFAGQVLIGLSIRREGKTDAYDAQLAYGLADAMLAARNKKE